MLHQVYSCTPNDEWYGLLGNLGWMKSFKVWILLAIEFEGEIDLHLGTIYILTVNKMYQIGACLVKDTSGPRCIIHSSQ